MIGYRASNEQVINDLRSDDPVLCKEASLGVNEYLRLRAKEDSFWRRILPQQDVTPADCDRQVDSQKLVIVKDMEPTSPAAMSVPFGNTPVEDFIDTPRYRVTFGRIMTPRITTDVANLLTYDMDIKEVFNNLMLKDILAEEDRKALAIIDANVGTIDAASGTRWDRTGSKGYIHVGAVSRDAISKASSGLGASENSLAPACALINNMTIWQIVALFRDELGGDIAEEMFRQGFKEVEIMGIKYIVTIKKDLVPTNIQYFFAAPKYLGENYVMEDVTMVTKNEAFFLEFFSHEMIGGAMQNVAAFCKVSYTGDNTGDWEN